MCGVNAKFVQARFDIHSAHWLNCYQIFVKNQSQICYIVDTGGKDWYNFIERICSSPARAQGRSALKGAESAVSGMDSGLDCLSISFQESL